MLPANQSPRRHSSKRRPGFGANSTGKGGPSSRAQRHGGLNKTAEDIEREAATHLLKRLAQRLSPDERKAARGLGLVSARLKMDDETRKITVTERTVATIGFDGIPYRPPSRLGGPIRNPNRLP